MHLLLKLKHKLSNIINILEANEEHPEIMELFGYLSKACEKNNLNEAAFILDKIIVKYQALIDDMESYITISNKDKQAQRDNLAALKKYRDELK